MAAGEEEGDWRRVRLLPESHSCTGLGAPGNTRLAFEWCLVLSLTLGGEKSKGREAGSHILGKGTSLRKGQPWVRRGLPQKPQPAHRAPGSTRSRTSPAHTARRPPRTQPAAPRLTVPVPTPPRRNRSKHPCWSRRSSNPGRGSRPLGPHWR